MNDAEYFARMAKVHPDSLCLSDAQQMHKMAHDGDLVHICGAFVQSLADLADKGKATYARCEITRDMHDTFSVTDGSNYGTASDAIEALIMAADSLAGKPVLAEPKPTQEDAA